MIALQITSMKQFMNHLLVADTFEPFLLEEAVISTASNFTIDGHVNREFYENDENSPSLPDNEFRPWSELKGLCFDLIKGKRTPLFFRFVLHLMPEKAAALLEQELHLTRWEMRSEGEIRIYEAVDARAVGQTLAQAGVAVEEMGLHRQDLEGYFLERMGGNNHV